jgi:trehalose 6-phosphate synthase
MSSASTAPPRIDPGVVSDLEADLPLEWQPAPEPERAPDTTPIVETLQRSRHLVVVANRLPVRRVHDESLDSPDPTLDGDSPTAVSTASSEQWERSPGGLVSALEPVVRASRTSWVGWTGSPDEPSAPALLAFEHQGIDLHPVAITALEQQGFYEGFSNGTLWPLYHDAIFVPQFHQSWWDAYETVNRRFAERTAEVASQGATVWIHDYQLQLVPKMLRELRPDLRIGFFLHIPFPAQELFLRLPWRSELAAGLLGADVVGFQTAVGADNFRLVARRLLGARIDGRHLVHERHRTRIGTYPVGIDAERIRAIASEPATRARAREIRHELGDPHTVLLGVDRLDYTKGIEVRLRAFRALLESGRIDPTSTTFVQIAQPSRDEAPGYAETRTLVEQMAGSINGDFGALGGTAVKYLHQGQDLYELVALYLAADVMLVTPFRDGMNLVAKEYVAARVDLDGVLILSEFAGAAHQMRQAVLVNPFDVRALESAIDEAVNGDRRQHRRRMAALGRGVHRDDAARWAEQFLADLESPSDPA